MDIFWNHTFSNLQEKNTVLFIGGGGGGGEGLEVRTYQIIGDIPFYILLLLPIDKVRLPPTPFPIRISEKSQLPLTPSKIFES